MYGKRNPDETRRHLLEAAYEEIHRVGFQAASLGRILERTGVTKGALYHHFPNKKALGYAVVDEVIRAQLHAGWVVPLRSADDPVDGIIRVLSERAAEMGDHLVQLGCPLNNLAQEMAPVDEGFRRRIEALFHLWRGGIAEALRRGQREGRVREDRVAEDCALYIVSSIEGCVGAAKSAQDRRVLIACSGGLLDYLEGLRRGEGHG